MRSCGREARSGPAGFWVQLGSDHGYGPLSDRRGTLSTQFTWGSAGDGNYRTGHARLRPGGLDPGTALPHLCAGARRYGRRGRGTWRSRRPDRAALGSDGRNCPGLGRKGWLCRTASATATSAASVSAKAVRTELAAAQGQGAGRMNADAPEIERKMNRLLAGSLSED